MIKTLMGNRILIKKQDIPAEEDETTESGILIPNKKKKTIYWEAPIEKVGCGVEEKSIKEGDTIVYIVGTATDITIDNEDYQFIPEAGIIAVR